jgi:predicted TIM-barrel fold metal-dependent hydrolase
MPVRADFESYLTWEGGDALARLRDAAAEAGMEYVVVMPKAEVEAQNDRLARDIAGDPRLLGCAMIDPHRATAVEEVRHFVKDCGFKGIKLMAAIHRFNLDEEPLVRPVVEAAAELGVVVSIHSGLRECHPDRIGTIAGWIPNTPIVMDHMGFPDHLAEGVAQAQAHPNIVMGTTILRFHRRWGTDPNTVVPTEVKSAIGTLGSERIVFGSNYPEYRPIQVMNALRRLEIGEQAEQLIFGENLARIYGL